MTIGHVHVYVFEWFTITSLLLDTSVPVDYATPFVLSVLTRLLYHLCYAITQLIVKLYILLECSLWCGKKIKAKVENSIHMDITVMAIEKC